MFLVCPNAYQVVTYLHYFTFGSYDIQHIVRQKCQSLKIVSCCIQGCW